MPPLGGRFRSENSGRSGPSCYSAELPTGPNIPNRGTPNTEFLTPPGDPERLAEVGDWIIECGTGTDLLDRVGRLDHPV